MKLRRNEWRAQQSAFDPRDLVFIDETWAKTNMTRRYGRAPKGERLVCASPHGHWKTITFTAALSASGMIAPMTIQGAMTGDHFVAYIEQVLRPNLRPGQIVVMDNLSCHKRAQVAEILEAAGCRLMYLPPYSPDLNPIEQAFAKLKSLLRRQEERTVAGLEQFLGEAMDLFSADECRNYFRHSGYHATPS